ncbi:MULTISPECIES: hypothetical protein [unclassified Pseudomonas]|uniref:hypothetical protein n=1 Tax=unclassified Pseudomonas TaxID=196821 RepID=UPI000C2F95CF|nr:MULTISPECIES: hypothetical protein [unclassified Pseudomonas]MCU1736346.1 hypothetical protein [Pseudomonas sp. 20S_6.2_Bac1]
MPAWKLFVALMGALVYLLITGAWFFMFAPEQLGAATVKGLVIAFVGTMAWFIASLCIAIHIIQNAWPAPPGPDSDKQSN